MVKVQGHAVFGGTAIGEVYFHKKKFRTVICEGKGNPGEEYALFEKALSDSSEKVRVLYSKVNKQIGTLCGQIFDVYLLLFSDENFTSYVKKLIFDEGYSAHSAVSLAAEHYSRIFAEMEDPYFRARSEDVLDISERILTELDGEEGSFQMTRPGILVADSLSPTETLQFDRSVIKGIITKEGSVESHAAILARTMGIPTLVGVTVDESWHGKKAVIDGNKGFVIVEPDDRTLGIYESRQIKELKHLELLQKFRGLANETKSGKKIEIFANIGEDRDVLSAINNDAGGIGLFRSEFLYMGKQSVPKENEQFEAYSFVARNMGNKPVIIRTLDIGADKKVDYMSQDKEDNPAMGNRAIRLCLSKKDIFKKQLRAILRAAVYGNIRIMLPMITSLWEIDEVKKLTEKAAAELEKDNIPYVIPPIGIMIETPAAALTSDILAKHVDFFSIGTNDLTQYVLAVDRQCGVLDRYYDSHHEAVLRLIKMVVENAHKEGINVAICGELASDMSLLGTFIDIGVDALSVSPGYILPMRKYIREME